ncbi:MAG TPA: glycerophosphodiester phosphodiesterase family protein [Gemmatimonadales bacterium]
MWHSVREVFLSALGDLRRSWKVLAITDLAYKAIAFALLMPATTLLLYWLRAGTSQRVVADTDIAMFFLTTPAGIVTLILGGSLIVAITAVETSCLMAVGVGQSQGVRLNGRGALRFGAVNALNILRLSGHMVLRVVLGVLPFALAAGGVYMLLLRAHDINYYLAQHPPEFWIAASLIGLIGVGLALLLARTIARWAFAWPLVVFEQVHPRQALGESARRAAGSYGLILASLAMWAVSAFVLTSALTWLMRSIGLWVAPSVAGSLPLLLLFLSLWLLVASALLLAVNVVNFSLFALVLTRLYQRLAQRTTASLAQYAGEVWGIRLTGPSGIGILSLIVLGMGGVAALAFLATRNQAPVVVIAHRGSSAVAPENTLAAFRLAADQHTDLVELDVQESSDGQVLVAHDADLMKVSGNPAHIWNTDAATLRAIDIGSYRDPRYAAERVPTLAEALAACKGRCKVLVELKSYGHNQHLEERVVQIVEAAGMVNECEFMSLDHDMARKLKQLRPSWRVGFLVAKAVGDLTELNGDFLAVEASLATRRFIRRAHRAGQDVYIWTVNDPAWMLRGLTLGVDGLITDQPDVARRVIAVRARMSEPQRFLAALLIRFGATAQTLVAEEELRP